MFFWNVVLTRSTWLHFPEYGILQEAIWLNMKGSVLAVELPLPHSTSEVQCSVSGTDTFLTFRSLCGQCIRAIPSLHLSHFFILNLLSILLTMTFAAQEVSSIKWDGRNVSKRVIHLSGQDYAQRFLSLFAPSPFYTNKLQQSYCPNASVV
jgi:hypothetical protein